MSKRKFNEKQHGLAIAEHAIDVWGWGTPAGQERAKRRAELLINYGAVVPRAATLELGCGTGLFTRALAQTGARVIAMDLSLELISRAEKDNGLKADFIVADAERLPFPSGAFDAVVGSSVLHHLQPEVAFSEVYRILRNDGMCAFAEPNMLNPQIAIQKNIPALKRRLGDSPDETAFFRWQAKKLMERAGFVKVNVRPYDFLHPSVPSNLIGLVKLVGQRLEQTPLVCEIAGSLIMWGSKKHITQGL